MAAKRALRPSTALPRPRPFRSITADKREWRRRCAAAIRQVITSNAAAAVDFHGDARDHAGLVGTQERCGVAHVLGRGETADWNRREEFGADLRRVLPHEGLE